MSEVESAQRVEVETVGDEFEWDDLTKAAIATGLGYVPGVGAILSTLVNLFWPEQEHDAWESVKDKVERLIDEKIAKDVDSRVRRDLEGLQNVTVHYLDAVKSSPDNTDVISQNWVAARLIFDQTLPTFRQEGHEVALLPLYALAINLHLALLRDGALHGREWGWSEDYAEQIKQNLTSAIEFHTGNVEKAYKRGYEKAVSRGEKSRNPGHECEPFRSTNLYVRPMTILVLDYLTTWPYFDAVKFPDKAYVELTRSIYTDPRGTGDDSGPIKLASDPTGRINRIEVWGYNGIDGVRVTYPEGRGPGGVTRTRRMGNSDGGSDSPPDGGSFEVGSENPIVRVWGRAGSPGLGLPLLSIAVRLKNGEEFGPYAGRISGGKVYGISYDRHILSSIHVNGVSDHFKCGDCAVFGFSYEDPHRITRDVARQFYIASPRQIDVDNLARSVSNSVTSAADSDSVVDYAQWDGLREKYWAHVESLCN